MTIPLAEVLIIVITTLKWKNKNEGGMCFVLLINSHVNMVLLALIIYCFVTYCLFCQFQPACITSWLELT